VPEDIALFIDFENIRYSMLNIQRREPDPQELIAVARRYGTVMVARAYADWSRQPEPFKGSLTAAMIDRVDCPAKQRDRIRMGTAHYGGGTPTGALGSPNATPEQGGGTYPSRSWSTGNTGQLPAIPRQPSDNGWSYQDANPQSDLDEDFLSSDEPTSNEGYDTADYQQREGSRQSYPYQQPYTQPPTGSLAQNTTGPLGYSTGQHTGNSGYLPAVNASSSTIVQSTVVQSTVDLNMLMDIIETVFDLLPFLPLF